MIGFSVNDKLTDTMIKTQRLCLMELRFATFWLSAQNFNHLAPPPLQREAKKKINVYIFPPLDL